MGYQPGETPARLGRCPPPPPGRPSPTQGRRGRGLLPPRALAHSPFPRFPSPTLLPGAGRFQKPSGAPGSPDLLRERSRAVLRRPYPLAEAAASADPAAARPRGPLSQGGF